MQIQVQFNDLLITKFMSSITIAKLLFMVGIIIRINQTICLEKYTLIEVIILTYVF